MSNKLHFAKMGAHIAAGVVYAKVIRNVLVNNTNLEPDSITVQVTSLVGAEALAQKTDPYTDAAVEKAFAWIESKKSTDPYTS